MGGFRLKCIVTQCMQETCDVWSSSSTERIPSDSTCFPFFTDISAADKLSSSSRPLLAAIFMVWTRALGVHFGASSRH